MKHNPTALQVGGAVVIMICYVTCMVGGSPPRKSRCLLGLTVVFNVGLALLMGFGIVNHNPTAL